jgi:hypothetical protein
MDLATGYHVDVPLPDLGPDVHHVLIRFVSNRATSPATDDDYTLGAAVVIDNLVLTDSLGFTEDFSGTLNPSVSFVISGDSAPFGGWARLFQEPTDNTDCPTSPGCAWIFTDHTSPTFANDPGLAFGPNSYVLKNWLDDIVISPWVTMPNQTPGTTVATFREFGGNRWPHSKIARAINIRGRDVNGCVGRWSNVDGNYLNVIESYEELDSFEWRKYYGDLTSVIRHDWTDIQGASSGSTTTTLAPEWSRM